MTSLLLWYSNLVYSSFQLWLRHWAYVLFLSLFLSQILPPPITLARFQVEELCPYFLLWYLNFKSLLVSDCVISGLRALIPFPISPVSCFFTPSFLCCGEGRVGHFCLPLLHYPSSLILKQSLAHMHKAPLHTATVLLFPERYNRGNQLERSKFPSHWENQ